MGILPPQTDYTNKDFEALRLRIFDLIKSVFPTWTNDAVANFGNLLAEAHCFVGDVLGFYQDQQAREGRFAFTQMRKNMIALTKLIGYELPGATAASCDVTLSISNADALVGIVTQVGSSNLTLGTNEITAPVKGEIQGSISIDLSATGPFVYQWEHSTTQTPYIVASAGNPDQNFTLPFGPFLDSSDSVSTPTQGTFTRVDSFFNSGPTDTHYRIQVDQNNLATIIFGDGQNGVIPIGNTTCEYKTGGGVLGNVEAGSLVKLEGSFVDSVGTKAYIESTNGLDAEGGFPREEVNAARVNAPESIRVLNRTVAREDYEINAKRVDGVGRALMLTSNEQAGIMENHGQLYILPMTGGIPSQTMLDSVEEMCTVTYPNTVTFQLEVLSAAYKEVNVEATVYLRNGQTPSEVKAAVEEALEDYFEPMMADGTPNPNVGFGYEYKDDEGNPAGEVPWSDIFNVVRDVSGIRKVGAGASDFLLNGLHDDVSISNWQFPSFGTLTLINGDTGTAI